MLWLRGAKTLIIRIINFELVQPIRPRYINVTDRQTDERTTYTYTPFYTYTTYTYTRRASSSSQLVELASSCNAILRFALRASRGKYRRIKKTFMSIKHNILNFALNISGITAVDSWLYASGIICGGFPTLGLRPRRYLLVYFVAPDNGRPGKITKAESPLCNRQGGYGCGLGFL